MIELGLDTFGDVTVDEAGRPVTPAQALRDLVEQAVLADQLGLDFIGVGEHHRPDFAVSAPEVVLGAIASRTERIRLGTAVTVLSTDDPVRVFQRFSTVDALSNGRAEIIAGRGSFTESFPLFGFELRDYEELFEDKLEELAALSRGETVRGGQQAHPRTASGRLPVWVGVGGSPESVLRAARHGLPLMLAIIGGDPLRFRPFVDLYRRALDSYGLDHLPIGAHSPGHVADSDEQAIEELWPHYKDMHDRIGAQRGWPPMTREQYEHAAGPEGALHVGSPDTVAAKIVRTARGLDIARFDMKYSHGTLPHPTLMKSIELYASKVVPLVRAELSE